MGKKQFIYSRKAFFAVILAVFVYTALFGVITVLKYNAFSYTDYDFALFIQRYWSILHSGSTSISLIGNTPIWGNALEVISYPFSLIYALLFQSPKALLVLKSFILGLGAIPVFLIARRKLPETIAAFFAVSYLLHPALWFANLYEYNDLVLVTPALLSAFYFLQEDKFKYFIWCVFICLMCRVNIAVVTAMFGVYALIRKKSLKWVLAPLLISIAWFLIGVFVVIPAFRSEAHYEVFYPQFGKSFGEILKNMILRPQILFSSLCAPRDASFLFLLLFPVGFISLFGSPELMICIFALIQHLASFRGTEHTIFFHYTLEIIPFIYISAIYGLARLMVYPANRKALLAIVFILPLAANFWYGPLSDLKPLLADLKKDDLDEQKEALLSRIPKDASVISTFEFTPRLANRKFFYSFHYIPAEGNIGMMAGYKVPCAADYALIDFNDRLTRAFSNPQSDMQVKDFLEKGNWGLIESVNGIALFKKGYASPQRLYEIKEPGPGRKGYNIKEGSPVRLSSYTMNTIKDGAGIFLKLSFRWDCFGNIGADTGIKFLVLDKEDKLVSFYQGPICYGIYPTYRWLPGQEITDNYNIILPKSMKPGEYSVKMLLYSMASGKIFPCAKPKGGLPEADMQQMILLGHIHV